MSTQYYTASSIDGFIADSDNSLSWLFQFSEPSGMEDEFPPVHRHVGAMAMGSTTYEWIADHTGFSPIRASGSTPSQRGCSAVGSCLALKGPDIRFVSGDVAPVHRGDGAVAEGQERLAGGWRRSGRAVP